MKQKTTYFLCGLATLFMACSKSENPTPTPGAANPTFASISPQSAKAGETLTLTGANFSVTASENEVTFTSASSTVIATVKTATATTLTVDVPVNATSGAISLKVKGTLATLASGFNGMFTIMASPQTNGNLSTLGKDYYLQDHIATDDLGNVYTTGLVGGKVLVKINAKGERVKVYAATDFGLDANEQPYIVGVSNDKNGNVWVLMVIANKPCRLYKITSASDKPTLDRTIDNTKSFLPTISIPDMEVASNGDLYYISEAQNYVVRKIDKAGIESNFISAVNGKNPFDETANNVTVTDLSLDANDNIYVSVTNQNINNLFGIYKYTTAGVQTKIFLNKTRGTEIPVNGSLATTAFYALRSMTVTQDGNTFFIGDGLYLRKISLTASQSSTIAGNGEQTGAGYTYNGDALKGRTSPAKTSLSADQKSLVINSYGVIQRMSL